MGARRVGGDAAFEQVTANALLHGVPSHFSTEVLAHSDLLDLFRTRPSAAIGELHAIACEEPNRDRLFALAPHRFGEIIFGQQLNLNLCFFIHGMMVDPGLAFSQADIESTSGLTRG